ncbi:MAG: G8 domain-containing protein [Pirellulales bacterium]
MISYLRSFVEFVRGSATRTKKAHSRRRINHRSALRVESLEPRRLLSVNQILFDAEAAQISITGTSGIDEVTVSYMATDLINVKVRSGGVSQNVQFPLSGVASVSFTGEDGNDTFRNLTDIRSVVWGGLGADVLNGGEGIDEFDGGDGDDILNGYAGNDLLNGGNGADKLRGGVDHDQLWGRDGNDDLDGEAGNDILFGDAGIDLLRGGTGDDKLRGGTDDDNLYGDDGSDNLGGDDGNDLIFGHAGDDYITGDAGDDKLRGGLGDDEMHGGDGNDDLKGEEGRDFLFGQAGNDLLEGGIDGDKLRGNAGDDQLFGDDGDDNLNGQEGADALYGLAGSDWLAGGDGNDLLRGGLGDDQLFGDNGDDDLSGDEGNDLLVGGAGIDLLLGSFGDDKMRGGAAADLLSGGDGNDSLDGQEGIDTLYGDAGNDWLKGGSGADVLRGGNDDDVLYGDMGNDDLDGQDGNDLLFGLAGDDLLKGGLGDDTIWGGAQNDQLWGNEGDDLLIGQAGDDQLFGNDGNNVLIGQSGDDQLVGSGGNDILIGGTERDDLDGNEGDDLLIGGSTIYDTNPVNLRSLIQIWAGSAEYSERIAAIESEQSIVQLESVNTVFHDIASDAIRGGDGRDWFFLTGSMPVYTPVMEDPDHEHDHAISHHHALEVIHTLPALEGFDLIDSLDNLQDVQANESIHSKVPHTADFGRQGEHLSLFQLVRYDQVSHIAIASGDWSNPATWQNGAVPTDDARVLISYGTHVNVDRVNAALLTTVRVDGKLSFATQSNSQLSVDTIVVSASGALEMGTELDPIAAHVTARLLFTNTAKINRVWDPYGISRGLISHGATTIHGAAKLERSALQGSIGAGTTQLTLTGVPLGWKVGDEIVVAGTVAGAQQDEVRRILAIAGQVVTIAPLSYDHFTPSPSMSVQVAHLTRNAVIESQGLANHRRGHVMFMHSRDVDIKYAGFYHLGRTDKLQVINDAVVDSNWTLQPGTGTNPRGRYAVHMHRNGSVNDGNPVVVHGSVVVDNPGWGFVNHSSYVDFTNNVAFNVRGAAFATEVGDEIGSFRNNFALQVTGSGEDVNSRMSVQDFGHQGDGFWFQGAGVAVTDNIAAGSTGSAFFYYTRGLIEGGELQTFVSSNLIDPSIAGGAATINVDFVPVREFARNVGFASNVGLSARYHLREAPHSQQSVFKDSIFWNNTTGVDLPYSHQIILRDLVVVYTPGTWPQTGVDSNSETESIVYENLTVVGYTWGIEVARGGNSVVSGGTFYNHRNIIIKTAAGDNRSVLITGPIQFNALPEEILKSGSQFDVFLHRTSALEESIISSMFYSDRVTLKYGPFDNQRVYSAVQYPTAIPFPAPEEDLPPEYVGLTSLQLQVLHGLTIGGELAPLSAVAVPRIGGLVTP